MSLSVPVGQKPPHRRITHRLFLALSSEYIWFYLLLIPSIVLLVCVVIIPMVFAFKMSLGNTTVVTVGGKGSIQSVWVGLQNYVNVLSSPYFWQAFRDTVYFSVVSLLIEVTVGVGIALLMNQKFFGRKVFRVIVFIPWAVPTVVNAMLWGMVFDGDNYGALNDLLLRMHWIQTPVIWLNAAPLFQGIPWLSNFVSWLGGSVAMNSMIIGDEWRTLPIVAVLLLAGLQTIPNEYYEAARVEGASAWRQFRAITVPLLGPILSIVLILRTMQLLRAFTLIFTLQQYGLPILSIEAYQQAFSFGNFGTGSAISFLVGILSLLIAVVYIKRLYKEEM